jgi:hypothetical protein
MINGDVKSSQIKRIAKGFRFDEVTQEQLLQSFEMSDEEIG